MGILIITLIVAFCSIVYELILGQALSAFLGDTITRYSITIGLYLFSMGFGAMIAEGRMEKKPEKFFVLVELLLTIFGGFSIILLFLLQSISPAAFVVLAHLLIVFIGVLTGFEIPLLIYIGKKYNSLSEGTIIGVDYLGAFVGSIFFSFIFYPFIGLIATALLVAMMNALMGLYMFMLTISALKKEFRGMTKHFLILQVFMIYVLVFCLAKAETINDYLLVQYLK